MSYTFRVIFEGVCAFVPRKPFFEDAESTAELPPLTVLLPDLRGALPVSEAGGLYRLRPSHFPLLKFDPKNLAARTTRKVDLVCRDFVEPREQALMFLKREQIRFKIKARNARHFTYANCRPCNEHRPDPFNKAEMESLWWLPRIAELDRRRARVRPDLLPNRYQAFPDDLIARLEIQGGHLKTFDFNRDLKGDPQVWRFALPNDDYSDGHWNRPIGNRLALEFYDVEGPVRLKMRRLANEVYEETLELAHPPGGARPVLEIEICNREPEVLFTREEEQAQAILPDADFEEFYFKCSADLGPAKSPSGPVPHHRGPVFFGPIKDPCSPSEMKP